ncbi:transporter substrate-binding domain-containing protein [Desulfosarcina sp.]|uniref:transporter substrate-binding domain-containing protein n=1 Tax=Desulfosarcina sp. TaxID=2027861 RepID=UPI0029AE4699|nr:transporter substrate-binding domain-containing protein [Desulfosarcina sp.]MDX2455800.1 transporter substrate-binding domain-containing protein [Desulfosarcina sp.]MDX2493262.1 transporter substrate-binding domain-containing protein [Desulfosarcina sp.]
MKKTVLAVVLLSVLALFMAVTVSAGPTMDRILKTGELVIGTSGAQPPMTAISQKGEIIGLDADIARSMAAALEVKVKFKILPFADLLPALEAGQVDMILSSMTITPTRNRKVVFVGPYLVSGKGILTLSNRFATLQQATGLNAPEVNIAALKDSTSQKYTETLMPEAKLIPIDSYDQGIDLLLKKKVDVVVADYPFCALTAYRYQDKGLLAGKAPLSFEPLGIAMPEDTLLVNWVQNFLILLQGNGQLPEMHKKWLTGGKWVDELP